MNGLLPQLGLVGILVLLNAGFAGTELALVSLREGQLQRLEQRSATGAVLARLAREPNRFLATIQIGITLAGFLASAAAAVSLAEPLVEPLGFLGQAAEPAAITAVTLILAYVTLVFGELAPKRVAMQRAERWGLLAARPLAVMSTITRPAVWMLSHSTDIAVRLMGGDPSRQREEVTEEELRDMVAAQTSFTPKQRLIIDGAFEISERTLHEVLRPRRDVFVLDADAPATEALRLLADSGYSRAPATIRRILRLCPIPVWVLRPGFTGSRILAAIDPDDDPNLNQLILELAQSQAERYDGELHVVHSWEPYGATMMPELLRAYASAAEAAHREAFDRTLATAHLPSGTHSHLVGGTLLRSITGLINLYRIDLLVMGSVGRAGLDGIITGNTAEQLFKEVRCSVLVVKPPGFVSPIDALRRIHAAEQCVLAGEVRRAREAPRRGKTREPTQPRQDPQPLLARHHRHSSPPRQGPAGRGHTQPCEQTPNHLAGHGNRWKNRSPGLIMGSSAERILDHVQCSIIAVKPEGFVSPVSGRRSRALGRRSRTSEPAPERE